MAADSVEICNLALTLIGTSKIVALSDPSVEARECNAVYDICRKAVLRDHPWNFATKRVILSTPDSTAPVFGFESKFPIPSDFIRVHTVYDSSGCIMDPGSYRVEDGFFLTDETVIWLKYVYSVTTATKFDAIFDVALAANIAASIGFKLSGSESTAQRCQNQYLDELKRAKFTDSVEDPSQSLDDDEWIRARRGRGDFVRDPQT